MTFSEIRALVVTAGAMARFAAALDLGVSHDRSALTIYCRLPVASLNPDREWQPIFLMIVYAWPAGTPLHNVLHDVLSIQRAIAYLTIEVNGVGASIGQDAVRHLRGATPRTVVNLCATTAKKKTLGYTLMLSLMERGQLLLLRHADAMRQFAGMQFEQGLRGAMHIENDPTQVRHDDICDSAYLATFPYTGNRGVGTRLSRWADPEHAVPDAPVPPSSGETFTTPNGLNVWRNPPLQSVEGQGLTFPDGWKEQPEAVHEMARLTIRKATG